MSISLSELVKRIQPERTVLFFGAGSSLPSGAPSVNKIIEVFGNKFNLKDGEFSLSELSSIIEQTRSRREMITTLRGLFTRVNPTGSLLNIPLYNWKNIYTTNYDDLIEKSYSKYERNISVFSSNFDFSIQETPETTKLFKIHGTIEKDEIDGIHSRIIISERDYDMTNEYRELLYNSLKSDISGADLIIIGYSLSDPHIKEIISKAVDINSKCHIPATIYLVLYTEDENRAKLHEARGLKVAFGGLNDFFRELHLICEPTKLVYSATGDPLDGIPYLRPVTVDVAHQIESSIKDASSMFNGWPASYADIEANLTFERTVCHEIVEALSSDKTLCVVILGASGTGKTTLAKQVMFLHHQKKIHCWEHSPEQTFLPKEWGKVADKLKGNRDNGVLFIDDAHNHLFEINKLISLLSIDGNTSLKLMMTSSRNNWNPRVKSPDVFKKGKEFILRSLDRNEIDNLLTLVDTNTELKPLVENSFAGFSRSERKRRLVVRCESDTFVCLKNIFANEKFDDIILREFAELNPELRNIYRLVSAMESSGINVHRQLVIRLLGIPTDNIFASLTNLVDIIHEYEISEKDGIYGWKGRHPVITDIVASYKMKDIEEYYKLFEDVIDNIIPTYDIEIRTIRQLCGFDNGISKIPDKHRQNKLLRRMISTVPGERVPRHRLIRNLIDINELEKAETEIRIFETDFRKADGPVNRYKILLLLSRAEKTAGILDEDRVVILEKARNLAISSINNRLDNKELLKTYCQVGLQYFKRLNDISVFNDAIDKLKEAEENIGDKDITSTIQYYQRVISGMENTQETVDVF